MTSTPTETEHQSNTSDLLVFVHIPKTAGSTFKRMLGRQFRGEEMPKIGPDYAGSIEHIKGLSAGERARVRCLSGHIPFGIHRYFGQRRVHYVSFVRDPVDRTLSEYFYLAKHPKLMPLLGLAEGAKLSGREFLEHQASVGMLDFQTRVLSGYGNLLDAVLPPYPRMVDVDAEAVIRRIADSFAVIGTVEQFDESLLLMKRRFGWRNVCYVSRNVAARSQRRAELKQELAAEIRELNPMDCKLSAYCRAAIRAKMFEQGDSLASELRRFRMLNRWYSRCWRIYRATGLRRVAKLAGLGK